jgi:hypothetical protein
MRCLGLYAILAWCALCIPANAGERFDRWSLEQHGDFVFALSFKRSLSFDDRTATSELAFVCNQEERFVAVLLKPLDGTFKNSQNSISIAIQKSEERFDTTDLVQPWQNGPDYIFLESWDDEEQLASYLKDREAEGAKSVHFYLPNDPGAGKSTNIMIIEVAGFSAGVAAFTSRCERSP